MAHKNIDSDLHQEDFWYLFWRANCIGRGKMQPGLICWTEPVRSLFVENRKPLRNWILLSCRISSNKSTREGQQKPKWIIVCPKLDVGWKLHQITTVKAFCGLHLIKDRLWFITVPINLLSGQKVPNLIIVCLINGGMGLSSAATYCIRWRLWIYDWFEFRLEAKRMI